MVKLCGGKFNKWTDFTRLLMLPSIIEFGCFPENSIKLPTRGRGGGPGRTLCFAMSMDPRAFNVTIHTTPMIARMKKTGSLTYKRIAPSNGKELARTWGNISNVHSPSKSSALLTRQSLPSSREVQTRKRFESVQSSKVQSLKCHSQIHVMSSW